MPVERGHWLFVASECLSKQKVHNYLAPRKLRALVDDLADKLAEAYEEGAADAVELGEEGD